MIVSETIFPSPLGEWRVASAAPPQELSSHVVSFWESGGHVGFGYEKLLPRGTAELIFNLAGPQLMYPGGDFSRKKVFKKAWVSGLFDQPLYVGPAYDAKRIGTHLVGVSITPAAIYSLFGLQAFELTSRVFEADELFGSEINGVWQQVANAATTEQRFQTISNFLKTCQLKLARTPPFGALWAMQQTQLSSGSIRISDLCSELSISRKHLSSLFKRTVGLNPKMFGRLTRFRAAMDRLDFVQPGGFAGLAIDLGYADQAHFINEFNLFAGEPPSRFLNSRSSDGESVLYESIQTDR